MYAGLTWRAPKDIRTGVAPVKINQIKWSFLDKNDEKCDYDKAQDMDHLFTCRNCPTICTLENLWLHV